MRLRPDYVEPSLKQPTAKQNEAPAHVTSGSARRDAKRSRWIEAQAGGSGRKLKVIGAEGRGGEASSILEIAQWMIGPCVAHGHGVSYAFRED